MGSDSHSAFLADTAFIASKGKEPKEPKDSKIPGKEKEKRSQGCFVCGKLGHIARDCMQRKTHDAALMVSTLHEDEDDREIGQHLGEIDEESAYLTTREIVLLSNDDVVFDNGSTVHLFKNGKLLTDIGQSKRPIVVNGVQANATGVRVDKEGKLGDIGRVYYSRNATANILSMSTLIDSGANITYDQHENKFSVQPKGSETTYCFSRRNVPGSGNKFFVCNMRDMMAPPSRALMTTVTENLAKYTKREVMGAKRARELLARLGYPSVENAIAMLRDGSGFDVTPYDFQVADAIWGPDIASLRGKTTRSKPMIADVTLGVPVLQQQQLLVIDIMFIDQVSTLVAVAYPLDLTFGVTLDKSISGRRAEQQSK